MKPSISFLNKELTRAIRLAAMSGRTHPGRITDNVVETTIECAKKIVKEPHLRGIALSHVISDEFRVISSCLIQQSTLNNHFFSRLVEEKCTPCAQQVLSEESELFQGILESQLGKDLCITDQNLHYFRSCCLSLARGVSIDESFDTDGPDIDGLKLWMMLGTLFCISKIIDLPDVTVH
ncbi:hypothetical protein [Vibrio sp. Vb0301]|uniref:hypothetical protein n=1 Tax=Vibrio sp. Vb0301 TaxID=3074622 RepID=UPI00296427B6|nr:hypothetical protein [Vibrio sp. Vb0301]MDW2009935.1 hypothetical protein [Vibrio sp. Vb0301]